LERRGEQDEGTEKDRRIGKVENARSQAPDAEYREVSDGTGECEPVEEIADASSQDQGQSDDLKWRPFPRHRHSQNDQQRETDAKGEQPPTQRGAQTSAQAEKSSMIQDELKTKQPSGEVYRTRLFENSAGDELCRLVASGRSTGDHCDQAETLPSVHETSMPQTSFSDPSCL